MTKKMSQVKLLQGELERTQTEFRMMQAELDEANNKLEKIESFLRKELHKGWALDGTATMIIFKGVFGIVRPDLKDALG